MEFVDLVKPMLLLMAFYYGSINTQNIIAPCEHAHAYNVYVTKLKTCF